MHGRRIRDAGDARRCLAAAEASGMARAQWARANGVDARSLNLWRINLARGRTARPEVGSRLVELVAAHSTGTATAYTVRCGDFAIEVPADFDDQALGRLLTLVAAC